LIPEGQWSALARPILLHALFAPAIAQQRTSRLFVRGLALVYLAAFVSLGVQIAGIAGPDGILPFGAYLQRAWELDGARAVIRIPTLFWLSASDFALRVAAALGAVCAVGVVTGFGPPRILLGAMFVAYLSLYHAGQIFTSFQWDYLLLECGLLAIFLLPAPTRLAVLLCELLLFRLRFESGLFKILSGDLSWRDLSAAGHYLETQPLPHVGAWYAHQLPDALLRAGTGFTLFAELVVPFFIFLPRPFRLLAAAMTAIAQLLILCTSNHNFINLLTLLLCLFLLHDRALARIGAGRRTADGTPPAQPHAFASTALAVIALFVIAAGSATAWLSLTPRRAPAPVAMLADAAVATGVGNAFHLFPTMQTERQELRIFGSDDGAHWQEIEFRFKPGAPDRMPGFIVPHQPRLDWMMWFLPPQSRRTGFWFEPLLQALRENRPAVNGLFARNPFASRAPPKFIRVLAYRYRFTTRAERARSGDWWAIDFLGEYPDVPARNP
jgi:hypothetical protein